MEEQKPSEQVSSEEAKSNESAVTESKTQPKMLKIYGREFDVSTEIGLAQASAWGEAHESARGRLAAEVGELRKEVEPLRKYNLKGASVDEVGLLKQVEQFRAEGNHLDADRIMFELYRQAQNVSNEKLEQERLWNDYQAQNIDAFKILPADVMKDYVFRNYAKELSESDNPFGLLDRIIKPKVPKLSVQSTELPPSVVGVSTSLPKASAPISQAKTDKADKGEWDKLMDEFGFN